MKGEKREKKKMQVSAAFGSDRAGWLCGWKYERQNSKCV